MPIAAGPALVLAFVLASAGRDLWFGHVFQDHDIFAVAAVTFTTATAIFVAAALLRDADQLVRLLRAWRLLLFINAATAAAWLSYFHALARLEPAVVNTLHAGIGPATIAAAAACGIHAAGQDPLSRNERRVQAGVLLVLAALVGIVLAGGAGFAPTSAGARLEAVAAALGSGVAITLALLATKRLNALGVGSDGVLATRFLAVVVVAGIVASSRGTLGLALDADLLHIAAAGLLLIVLPIYFLQLGLARSAPITVEVLCAIGPVLIFAGQMVEGRVPASPWTLTAILAYAGLSAVGALLRGHMLVAGYSISDRLRLFVLSIKN
ncbi:MAG: hypothetical protein L0210_11865 [Rhodospirillales bacterium]|nr:hypothetical protein [Rhodospirillales bacterium]